MAISSNVEGFLQKVASGVRPNMFEVGITFPTGITGTVDTGLVNILCKSAALPASSVGTIEVPFRGRTVKIAGDRTFDNWTATFINDKDMKVRQYFEKWLNLINSHEGNTAPRFLPNGTAEGYMADLYVSQLEKDAEEGGSVIRTYRLHHCFPTNVSAIDLAYDSNDQIAEFTVEWQYSFFTAGIGDVDKATGTKLSSGASPRDIK